MTEILTQEQIQQHEARALRENYFQRVAVATDDLFQAMFGGRPGITISDEAGVAARKHQLWGVILASVLDAIQKNHVVLAAAGDEARAQQDTKIAAKNLAEVDQT